MGRQPTITSRLNEVSHDEPTWKSLVALKLQTLEDDVELMRRPTEKDEESPAVKLARFVIDYLDAPSFVATSGEIAMYHQFLSLAREVLK